VYRKALTLLLGWRSRWADRARWALRLSKCEKAHNLPIRKGVIALDLHVRDLGRDIVAKKGMVGTITGVFDGALDGIVARLVRRRKFGYTVELLESKRTFQKGDIVHLSPAEFLMQDDDPLEFPLRTE
jgi:hypothetical protein